MKVWSLMDNVASCSDYKCEHGLSYWIKTKKHNILFDSGETSAFAENAARLGLDLADIDIAILSHGHSDHGGGLLHFLDVNHKAKIYMSRTVFEEHFNANNGYIGLHPDLMGSDRIVFTDGDLQLDEELTIYTCLVPESAPDVPESAPDVPESAPDVSESTRRSVSPSRSGGMVHDERRYPFKYPVQTFGLLSYKNGAVGPDTFDHEQYLLIREGSRSVLFSGCSHKGILNIMSWFRPDILFGGFHYFRMDTCGSDAEKLTAYAEELSGYNTLYYTGHCTGTTQYEFLNCIMGDRLRYLSAGESVEFS